jgi:hypothetical protein
MHLLRHGLNDPREVMILPLPGLGPGSEISKLAIVAVVGKPHFRANENDFLVVYDHAAIVNDILVSDWPEHQVVCEGSEAQA